jgi:hypothetical protein
MRRIFFVLEAGYNLKIVTFASLTAFAEGWGGESNLAGFVPLGLATTPHFALIIPHIGVENAVENATESRNGLVGI